MFIEAIEHGYVIRCVSSDEKRLLDAVVAAYQAFKLAYYGEDEEEPNQENAN